MPPIIYGTAWKKNDTERLVTTAITLGFRGIDTACQPKHYDEAGVGASVAACLNGELSRSDLYLQTKFTPISGQDPQRVPYDATAPVADQVTQSFAVSLRNLRTNYVDGLLLHSPLMNTGQTLEIWQAIEVLVDAGAVRLAGISNCYRLEQLKALYRSARIKPAIVQNRFYAETRYDREIREFCRNRDIVYQSFWTLTANPHLLSHRILMALSSKYGRTPAQMLFRYLTQNAIIPLTGTQSELHMGEDLAIFEFEIDDRDCMTLAQIF